MQKLGLYYIHNQISFSNEKVFVHFFIYRLQLIIIRPSDTHHLDEKCKLDETNTFIVNFNSKP